MNIVKNKVTIVAALFQTFTLFKLLLSENTWTLAKHDELCELLTRIADLRRELGTIVGTDEAYELVKEAYLTVFPEG